MKRFASLFFGFIFGACALMSPTDSHPPAGMHTQPFSNDPVERFSPRIPEGPLTLQDAIDIALANNPVVAAAKWDVLAAEARQDQAAAGRMPRVGIEGEYRRTLDRERVLPTRGEGEPGAFSRDIVSGDLVLSVPLFAGGRLVNTERAAAFFHEASEYGLSQSRQALVFDVSNVFFNILAQHHVIEAIEFSEYVLKTHLKRADELISAEKAAKVDRMRTGVRLADVRQELVREKAVLSVQQRTLAALMGLQGHGERVSPEGDLALREKPALPTLDEAFQAALKNRQDYLEARAVLEARARNVDAARAARWPMVSLQGAYGGRWAAGSARGAGDEYGDVGRIGLAMEMPLFEGGRIDAAIREERADLAAAQERFRSLRYRIQLEIETALSNIRASEERVSAVGESIELARESLRIEEEKYAVGRGAIADVLDAQAALLASEKTVFRAMAELRTAIARLELAMGGP